MEKKKLGNELEEYVASRLKTTDKYCRPTRGSGNGAEYGDIKHKNIYVECKNRSTKDITIKEDVWNKLLNEIPYNSAKLPLYVLGNKNKKRWAVLDFEDFIEIYNWAVENGY